MLIGSLLGYLYYNREQIEKAIISNLNEYVNTPINVASIDLDFIQKFPNVSLKFKGIEIKGSKTSDKSTLLVAKELLLTFSIKDMLRQNYNIKKVYLEDAYITMLVDKDGTTNYDIIKKKPEGNKADSTGETFFSLNAIHLTNIDFQYLNLYKKQEYSIVFPKAEGSFKTESDLIKASFSGDAQLKHINVGDINIIKDKDLNIQTRISLNTAKSTFEFTESRIKLKETIFVTEGKFSFADIPHIDLSIKSADSKVSTLLSLLPENIYNNLKGYNSSGAARFKANIKGDINTTKSPDINVEFGFNNMSLIHPTTKISINKLNLSGMYTNKDQGHININGFNCAINGNPVRGELLFKNFKSPYIKAHFSTKQDINSWLGLTGYQDFKKATGSASVNFNIDGKVEDIKNKVVEKTHISGEASADIEELTFNNGKTLRNTQVRLRMAHQDLVLDTLKGMYATSDFDIKGSFKSFITFLLDKEAKLNLEAVLNSNSFNIDDFYTPIEASNSKAESSNISLPDNLFINFKCQVNDLAYKKYDFKRFKGTLKILPSQIVLEHVSTQLAGGEITLKGEANTLNQKNPRIDATIELKKIYIDTVMRLFDNFDQKFITVDNLQGQLTTKVYINFSLNDKGKIDPSTIFSNIDVNITNGRLLNFEPMQKLARFTDEKELADIKFSELKNSFHIENSILYVPEMTIKSNLNTLSIMGSHKFTTEMDYRLKIDLKRKTKDSDEKFGVVREPETGKAQIFLTLKGTPDNLKIAYDKEAVKGKIQDKWKDEKKEMKNLFKKEPPKDEKKVQIDTSQSMIDLE